MGRHGNPSNVFFCNVNEWNIFRFRNFTNSFAGVCVKVILLEQLLDHETAASTRS